jgi:hypothetical protein
MARTPSALDVVNLMKQQEKELEDIKSRKLTKVMLLIYSSMYPSMQEQRLDNKFHFLCSLRPKYSSGVIASTYF